MTFDKGNNPETSYKYIYIFLLRGIGIVLVLFFIYSRSKRKLLLNASSKLMMSLKTLNDSLNIP